MSYLSCCEYQILTAKKALEIIPFAEAVISKRAGPNSDVKIVFWDNLTHTHTHTHTHRHTHTHTHTHTQTDIIYIYYICIYKYIQYMMYETNLWNWIEWVFYEKFNSWFFSIF